ncbi:MAG: hypothetical protein HY302_14810, partial [Opitutae bacterium]|nr:hypothetical protein [Opitutae bacterium]
MLALLLPTGRLLAANVVVSWTTQTTVNGAPTQDEPNTAGGGNITFENTTVALTSFVANNSLYGVAGLADAAYVRRNHDSNHDTVVDSTGDTTNQSSIWYRDGAGGANTRLSADVTDYPTFLLRNTISGGSDNTFSNDTGPAGGNIERLDFAFTGGLTATAALSFAVFERGAVGVHDAFKIAAITGWDSINNRPTSYGPLTSQAGNWGGTANVQPDFNYHLHRYTDPAGTSGDMISSTQLTANTETGTQGIGGIVFSTADLGLTVGTTIYGYSLFGFDTTGTSAQLLDWTDTTFYPANTTGATGTGGIDLATINGINF